MLVVPGQYTAPRPLIRTLSMQLYRRQYYAALIKDQCQNPQNVETGILLDFLILRGRQVIPIRQHNEMGILLRFLHSCNVGGIGGNQMKRIKSLRTRAKVVIIGMIRNIGGKRETYLIQIGP